MLEESLGSEAQVFPNGTPVLVFNSAGLDLQNIRTYDAVDAGIVNFTFEGTDAAAKLANPKHRMQRECWTNFALQKSHDKALPAPNY